MACLPQASKHQPHSIAFSAQRQTVYATIPSLGVITALDLLTSRTQLLVPRGVIREPTFICFVPSATSQDADQNDNDFDLHESDSLYVADRSGCRVWRVRLGDGMWLDPPELIYQSYLSPNPRLHLQSLADYARDDASDEAAEVRNDARMRIRAVTVDAARGRLFWLQGDVLMCASIERGADERADERSDVWVLEEGLEGFDALTVDATERWLCLRDGTTNEEARLCLADLLPTEELEEDEQIVDEVEMVNSEPYNLDWKDVAGALDGTWTHSDTSVQALAAPYTALIPAT